MRVVIQRVNHASCEVGGVIVSSIQEGYLLLVGFTTTDTKEDVKRAAKKISNLRIFSDENGKMNRSILEVKGEILSISQFTLYADLNTGNRPSFTEAMHPAEAAFLYDLFNQELTSFQIPVSQGVFGADMNINLENKGPVTVIYDTNEQKNRRNL